MGKIYHFSAESVKRAEAAYFLGFHVIGKESVPISMNHSITRVYMKNVKEKTYLNRNWFPEIDIDDEVAVTYIIHWRECNKVRRIVNSIPSDEEESNRKILERLAKMHCIWIRDIYSRQIQFTDMMPWPKANLMGKAFPIFEFIECFNEEYAHEGFDSAIKMDVYLQNEILKDYFEKGNEGFHFEVDSEILGNRERFNECLEELYNKFPHLRPTEA